MSKIYDYDGDFVYASQLCAFPIATLKVKEIYLWLGSLSSSIIQLPQLMRTAQPAACGTPGAAAEQWLLWFLKMHFSHPRVSVNYFLC